MNNLAELLSSPPDEISELNGVELVRKKVIQYQHQSSFKYFWSNEYSQVALVAIMGGAYPGGQEFNFDCGEVAIPFHFNQNSLLLDFTLSQTL